MPVACPRVRVYNADWMDCTGVYDLMTESAHWAPYRPRYKKTKGSVRYRDHMMTIIITT